MAQIENPAVRRCPEQARFSGDIVGCGSTNVSEPDDEGLCDCHACGIWFRTDEAVEAAAA